MNHQKYDHQKYDNETDGWGQWKRQVGFFVFIINFQHIQYGDLESWI